MKKLLVASLSILSLSAFSADIQLTDLSKSDVEKVGNEFAVNFAHTTVSAPETDGAWGIEVGAMGGTTYASNLKKVVNDSGGDGKDFKYIYHAGLIARVHIPFDLFFEATALPEREISEVTVKSGSFGLGWNAGAFFGLPLDLAIGASASRAEVDFDQEADPSNLVPESNVNVKTKTQIGWIGVSRSFLFITPYAKVGYARSQADIKVDASGILNYTSKQKEEVDMTGGYLALGANLQLFFLKIGLEFSQMNGVKNSTGKISFDF